MSVPWSLAVTLLDCCILNYCSTILMQKDADNRKREADKALNENVNKFEQWLERYSHQTKEQLIAYAKRFQQEGIDYFQKKFYDPSGNWYNMINILKCCNTIFNPFSLKNNVHQVHVIQMQAQGLLPLLNFPEFDHEFINLFVKYDPKFFHHAVTFEFNWDGFRKSRLFETRL